MSGEQNVHESAAAERERWTPEAALAYIKARPGDTEADAIIRDLCAEIAFMRDREASRLAIQAPISGLIGMGIDWLRSRRRGR